MKIKITILTILILFLGCNEKRKESFVITGHNTELAGKTIYLKKYNHFDYLDQEYILDSTIINSDGSFSFDIKNNFPNLITISKYNLMPLTYQVFKNTPQDYYYSMCSQFLASSPTIYMDNPKSIRIDNWDSKNNLNSVKYADDYLNRLRKYYKSVNYRKDIRDENRIRIDTTKEYALESIFKYRETYLSKYSLNSSFNENSFQQYFRTEVYLGAINEFLQWYSQEKKKSFDDEFFKNLMSVYTEEKWHPNSLEYYKFNEHYVTYLLNLERNSSNVFYEPSKEKIEIAKKNVNSNIKNIYLSNLKKLLGK
ncbi:MAG: hypothetical protein V3V28_06860 [Polaribacter sp.]|uniref:hypothetical protein n=1 Tax=Polaribacter sp. TaxID=1920175 RepID=UPI002F356E59